MNNRVVYTLYNTFAARGFSCLRFNFRGVGRSQGIFAKGEGELSDAASALDWLQSSDPVGRKLDFLTQEFNREANTLCAKAQHKTLTRIGLDLKTVIDQMREQVQNIQ